MYVGRENEQIHPTQFFSPRLAPIHLSFPFSSEYSTLPPPLLTPTKSRDWHSATGMSKNYTSASRHGHRGNSGPKLSPLRGKARQVARKPHIQKVGLLVMDRQIYCYLYAARTKMPGAWQRGQARAAAKHSTSLACITGTGWRTLTRAGPGVE